MAEWLIEQSYVFLNPIEQIRDLVESEIWIKDVKLTNPYTHATHLPLGGIPLAFTVDGLLLDHPRVRLGNVTTCRPLVANRWSAGGLRMAATRGPLPSETRQRTTSILPVGSEELWTPIFKILLSEHFRKHSKKNLDRQKMAQNTFQE